MLYISIGPRLRFIFDFLFFLNSVWSGLYRPTLFSVSNNRCISNHVKQLSLKCRYVASITSKLNLGRKCFRDCCQWKVSILLSYNVLKMHTVITSIELPIYSYWQYFMRKSASEWCITDASNCYLLSAVSSSQRRGCII